MVTQDQEAFFQTRIFGKVQFSGVAFSGRYVPRGFSKTGTVECVYIPHEANGRGLFFEDFEIERVLRNIAEGDFITEPIDPFPAWAVKLLRVSPDRQ